MMLVYAARARSLKSVAGLSMDDLAARPAQIWVDADACPVVVKEMLYRAAERTQTAVTFVANQYLSLPKNPWLKMQQVEKGFDVADHWIVQAAQVGDLVITADIPLADEVLEKGAQALNPRGEKYSLATIKAKLTLRDFMDTMRGSGEHTGGPAPISPKDKQAFANQLDRWLANSLKSRPV
jgi:uncharacterized protein YaiI (UPF0178 family)